MMLTVPAADSPLAVDVPSAQRLDESARRVFAHHFRAHPISFDDEPAETDAHAEGLLAADGEGGNYSAYGGLPRQRPLPRPVALQAVRSNDRRVHGAVCHEQDDGKEDPA